MDSGEPEIDFGTITLGPGSRSGWLIVGRGCGLSLGTTGDLREAFGMRTISVVGAGQAGTLLAVGLRKAGYDVQLFSDKTAEQMRDDIAPTGAAAIFADSVDVERRLGCDTYEQQSVPMDGIHLFFSPKVGQELVHFGAPLEEAAGAAVDVRLKSYDRMRQLEELGGRLVIDSVDVDSLDEIAADSALTVVSTGRGGLSTLFPRHPGRSVYDKPQRQLLMILVRGIATDGTAFPNRLPGQTPVCFNLFGDAGEFFWVPFLHKSGEPVWCMLFEAKPGGPFDRWADVSTVEQAFETAAGLVREFTPWDWESMRHMEPMSDDRFSWLKGSIPPTVRQGAGKTPGGHAVLSLGDTSVSYDPIGGQGAGSGVQQAGHYFDAIVERGERPWDAEWMDETFERFYASHVAGTYRFNNTLLEPLDKTGVRVMTACFADQRLASQFLKTFNRPPTAFPWISDRAAADEWIRAHTGRAAASVVRSGTARIVLGQLKNKVLGRHFARS
jgi:2-polyprenyl-6-methoxyphenol hydroxylase-like FAD-dependent oxidoreductase